MTSRGHSSDPAPIVVTVRSIEKWVKGNADGKIYENALQFRNAAIGHGLVKHGNRYTVNGRSETLLLNRAAFNEVERITADGKGDSDIVAWLKTVMKDINEIMPM